MNKKVNAISKRKGAQQKKQKNKIERQH